MPENVQKTCSPQMEHVLRKISDCFWKLEAVGQLFLKITEFLAQSYQCSVQPSQNIGRRFFPFTPERTARLKIYIRSRQLPRFDSFLTVSDNFRF